MSILKEAWYKESAYDRQWHEALEKWKRSRSSADMMQALRIYRRIQNPKRSAEFREAMAAVVVPFLKEAFGGGSFKIRRRDWIALEARRGDAYLDLTFRPHIGETWKQQTPTYVAAYADEVSAAIQTTDGWRNVYSPFRDNYPYTVAEIQAIADDWLTEHGLLDD